MPKSRSLHERIAFWSCLALMVAGAAALTASVWHCQVPKTGQTGSSSVVDILKASKAEAGTIDDVSQSLLTNGRNSLVVRPSASYEEEGLALEEVNPNDEGNDLDRRDRLGLDRPEFLPPDPDAPAAGSPVVLSEVNSATSVEGVEVPSLCSEAPWVEHQVAKGESLGDIAQKYGVPVSAIMTVNGIKNANRLTCGQVLIVPKGSDAIDDALAEVKFRAAQKASEKQKADPIAWTNYTVAAGDSLWSIAAKFNLSVDSILGANTMKKPDMLRPGMALRIPNQDGLVVKVQKGTTLPALAKKYDVSETAMRMANNIPANGKLTVGAELFIPGASATVAACKAASASGGFITKAPQAATAAAVASVGKGKFAWPLRGRINSPFGWRIHPIAKRRWFHTGIDIQGARHTPIRAARAGQVIFAGWMNGYGRVVVTRHDSVSSTLYAHAQTLKVCKGQQVSAGQVIATVGTSGRSTGPHLHFEIRLNNKPTNPMSYLR
ncbi:MULTISPECIES: LysM peptidoglycan-binding domain-containing M23 family metallopeptidase [Jonquetella]|uniref:Metalloendopeptidase-like membrane protein n=1 Tax=Jonquetella anthropi DSM 22815 TaxID=885272 RepID=H0UL45_9BACT|nr:MULTISPECIES: LysM peptidoglycan-binding domain-containing M23 family metallopeptidase [Jonquetella]EHM13404.1 metalloendopeptidase-like membrane protein [Jonquetella anthropi DSM 22815]ERL24941.1 LysM domain protein [Jonquetella sp. BV3C21]